MRPPRHLPLADDSRERTGRSPSLAAAPPRPKRAGSALWWRALSLLCPGAVLTWAWQSGPPLLTRGPYQQSLSATGITIVCKTGGATAVTLRYGEHAGPPWEGVRASPAGTTHVFALKDLRPETTYVYELAAG